MVPFLFLAPRTVLGDCRPWPGVRMAGSSLGPCPLHGLCREPVPLASQGPQLGRRGEGVLGVWPRPLLSQLCLPQTPPLSPKSKPHPVSQHPQLQSQTIFSIESIYSFNKHSQNPTCQEARPRLSQPLEAHGQGSKGLGTDLRSREGLGVLVGDVGTWGCEFCRRRTCP